MRQAADSEADRIEVTAEAQDAWVQKLLAGSRSFGNDPDCTPGYYNNEGRLSDAAAVQGSLGHPDGPVAYFEYIKDWRESGDFAGLSFD